MRPPDDASRVVTSVQHDPLRDATPVEHAVPSFDQCCAGALASLPQMGPRRLRALLGTMSPSAAWDAVRGHGAMPDHLRGGYERDGVIASWRTAATDELLADVRRRVALTATRVIVRGEPAYPSILAADPEAPAVLFVRGSLAVLGARRVAVVGTRAATASGRHFARELGHDLARHGVCVVSGLARGIDVAAHRGALSTSGTGPVAVVAGGLDRPYPREHTTEWNEVARRGALLCESPPGTAPDAFRFPLRNRIIAALSEVLVVVESRARGGSMLTVDHAIRRGVQVMAVPGAPSNVTSEGTNALLVDGCAPVRDAADVLDALGLDHSRSAPRETRPTPCDADRAVLDVLGAAPLSLDELVAQLHRPVHDVAVSLGRLAAHGWVVDHAGWWEFVRTTITDEREGRQ